MPGTIRSALQGRRPVLRSDGTLIRDYLYVEDAAEAYIGLAERAHEPGISGEAWNYSNELQLTAADMTRRVLAACGRADLELDIRGEAVHEIAHQYLSAAKARDRLGWAPAHGLDEGLRRTVAWYRAPPDGRDRPRRMTRPLLAICIPTYNRAEPLGHLLDRLHAELGDATDVVVLVADNASRTARRGCSRARPSGCPLCGCTASPRTWARSGTPAGWSQTRPTASTCGSSATTTSPSRAPSGTPASCCARTGPPGCISPTASCIRTGASRRNRACPPRPRSTPIPAACTWRRRTGSRSSRPRSSAATTCAGWRRSPSTDNLYFPLIWYFRASLEGPCVVADRLLVTASADVSWGDRMAEVMTRHFIGLYDEAIGRLASAEEFGRSLDSHYTRDHYWCWKEAGAGELIETVRRFPHSRVLRRYLWTFGRELRDPRCVAEVAAASAAAGDDATARALVAEGEAAFGEGDAAGAAELFTRALEESPAFAEAWNDLAVALHAMGSPQARVAVATAVELDPTDENAWQNHVAIMGAAA